MDFNYKIIKVIGNGAYGSVLEVKSSATGEHYAAKIAKANGKVAMVREADIHSRLTHPNILQFVSSFQSTNCMTANIVPLPKGMQGQCSAIILELCNGGTLEDKIKSMVTIPISHIRSHARELASGLLHLKENKIVHRDIKPANILFCGDNVKIADFGFADLESNITEESSGVGTPLYMSLEALNGFSSYQSDVFSFGVILYKMYTHYMPYETNVMAELRKLLAAGEVSFKLTWRDSKDRDFNLEDLIIQCMIKDPNERMTIEEVIKHPFFTVGQLNSIPIVGYQSPATASDEMLDLNSFRKHRVEFGSGTRNEFYVYLANKFPSRSPMPYQSFTMLWDAGL